MSLLLTHGTGYNAFYASDVYTTLTSDWVGSVSFYSDYPGTANLTKAMTVVDNTFALSLTVGDLATLSAGLYTFITTIENVTLGLSLSSLEYATVSDVRVDGVTMCKIFGTIIKPDGTATGTAKQRVVNSVTAGLTLVNDWSGVEVKFNITHSLTVDTSIVGTELMKVYTDANGYFEAYVIQGLSVTVSCFVLGASFVVDTTGHATIDISTLF